MDKYSVVMTPKADEDLQKICDFIAEDSPIKAIEFAIEFRVKVKKSLWSFPKKFRKIKNTHVYTYGNYLVMYKVKDDIRRAVILRITNSAQYLRYKNYFY